MVFRTLRGPLNMGNIVLLMCGLMLVAASMKAEANQLLRPIAKPGHIKEPLITERKSVMNPTETCVNTRDNNDGNTCAVQMAKTSISCQDFLGWGDCDKGCNLCACSTATGTSEQHCSGHGTCDASCTKTTCSLAKCICDSGWTGAKCEISDLALPSFAGFCRYHSNQRDWIKDLASTSASKCHEQCRTTHNCVAFAFSPKVIRKECDLYAGGPYTSGNGKSDSTCYIMSQEPPTITAAPAPTTLPAPAPATTTPVCSDKIDNCDDLILQNSGFCTDEYFVTESGEYCQKTCGFCESDCIDTPDWNDGQGGGCAEYRTYYDATGDKLAGIYEGIYFYPEKNCCGLGKELQVCFEWNAERWEGVKPTSPVATICGLEECTLCADAKQ